jgi:hypothetical protein
MPDEMHYRDTELAASFRMFDRRGIGGFERPERLCDIAWQETC